jgi:hypothetical protein
MKFRAPLLLLFVPQVVSCGTGSAKLTTTIDPNIPREDPSSYPNNPDVYVPPVIACPFKSTSGCPDAGVAADPADASGDTTADSDASSEESETTVEDSTPPNDAAPDASLPHE